MKKFKNIKWAVLGTCCALLASMLVNGCASASGGGNAVALAAAQLAVTEGASIGTSEAIKSSPALKADFTLAANVLTSLSTGTNVITSASIQAVLVQAGEKNQLIDTIITDGLSVVDGYITQIAVSNPNSVYLQAVGWLASGINEGLSSTPDLLKAKYHAR